MSLILLILLILILILFLAIIIILYIGFSVSAKLNVKSSEAAAEIDFKWLNFTLYHMDFPKNEEEEETKKEKTGTKKESKKDEKEEKTLSEKLEEFFYKFKCKIEPLIPFIKEAWDPILEFLIKGSKSFKLKLLYIKFFIGFEETSATALTVGYIWAFASILNIAPMVDISAIPDFENEVMDMHSQIIIEIYPLKAIKAGIVLLTKKSVLKLIFKVIKVIM